MNVWANYLSNGCLFGRMIYIINVLANYLYNECFGGLSIY